MTRVTTGTVIVLSSVALILNIVGLAIPYWEHTETDYGTFYYGLWKVCGKTKFTGYLEICSELDSRFVTTSLEAVRAMEILGVIVLSVSLLGRIAMQCSKRQQYLRFKRDGVLAIFSGLLTVIGTVIFGTKTQYEFLEARIFDLQLHAGFGICVVAGGLAIIAGTLRVFFDNKRESSSQRNQRAQTVLPVIQPIHYYVTPYQPSAITIPPPTTLYSRVASSSAGPCNVQVSPPFSSCISDPSESPVPRSQRSLNATAGGSNGQSETTTPLPLCN